MQLLLPSRSSSSSFLRCCLQPRQNENGSLSLTVAHKKVRRADRVGCDEDNDDTGFTATIISHLICLQPE